MNLYRLLLFVTLAVRVSSANLEGDTPFSLPRNDDRLGHSKRSVQEVGVESQDRHGRHRSTLSARVNVNANVNNGDPNPSLGDQSFNDIELPPYTTPSRPNSPVTHPNPVHFPTSQDHHRGSQSSYPSESLPPSYDDSALPAPAAVHHNSPPAAEGHHVVPMSTGERLRPPSSLPPPYSPGRSSYVNADSQTDANHPSPLDHDQEEAGPHAQNSGLAPPSPDVSKDSKLRRCARVVGECKWVIIGLACMYGFVGGMIALSKYAEKHPCEFGGPPSWSNISCPGNTTSNTTLRRRGVSSGGKKEKGEEQEQCPVEPTEESCDCNTATEVIAADGKMHQLGGNAKHTKRDVLKSVYRPRL
ncbi:hypothetical protein C8R42DRAFT_650479 [Lentinula raphanica]|nr:hypothetical protein C8R42DRAFT_650479 [Lentinula raphanica]